MKNKYCIINGVRISYDGCAENRTAYADVAEKIYLGWGVIEGTTEYRHFWKWG